MASFFSNEIEGGGIGVQIATEAFRQVGLEAEYIFLPWRRARDAALYCGVDASLGWWKSNTRMTNFNYSAPLFSERVVFFYNIENPIDWRHIEDVAHLKIGVTLGYHMVEFLKPVVREGGGKLEIVDSDLNNMRKLINKRIDVFACSETVGLYLLQQHFTPDETKNVSFHPRTVYEGGLHMIISKTHPTGMRLMQRFNTGLQELRKSGRLEDLKKHFKVNSINLDNNN